MKRSTILITTKFRDEVEKELNSKSRIGAFFLIHSYIEAFLRELLFYPLNYSKLNSYERKQLIRIDSESKFKSLLNLHFYNQTISTNDFNQIIKINKFRNSVAHNLLGLDRNNDIFLSKIDRHTSNGINICENLQSKFIKRLNTIEKMY